MGKPFKLSVKAVIQDEQGRCLLIRRSHLCKGFTGQWEWLGGKVDQGEDFAQATCRETLEETGLEIELTALAGATQFEIDAIHVIVLCMQARVIRGELRLSDEHDEFAWVPWEDFANWDLHEHMRTLMLDYAKQRINST